MSKYVHPTSQVFPEAKHLVVTVSKQTYCITMRTMKTPLDIFCEHDKVILSDPMMAQDDLEL